MNEIHQNGTSGLRAPEIYKARQSTTSLDDVEPDQAKAPGKGLSGKGGDRVLCTRDPVISQ